MRFALVVLGVIALLFAACSKKGSNDSAPAKSSDDKDGARGSGPGAVGNRAPDPNSLGPAKGGINLDGDLEIVAGAIDKDVVRRVVKDNTSKLQYCYEKTLLGNPGIEGKVIATFTIAAEGHVSDVKASGVHPEVETCVADAVKAFKFPPSGKKVDVSYPFAFKPA